MIMFTPVLSRFGIRALAAPSSGTVRPMPTPPVGTGSLPGRYWRRTADLAAKHDLAPPAWTELRVLRRPWFPAELNVQRADALVRAPAAFRKHGVYLSAADLEAA